jgi:hypothetical protein
MAIELRITREETIEGCKEMFEILADRAFDQLKKELEGIDPEDDDATVRVESQIVRHMEILIELLKENNFC